MCACKLKEIIKRGLLFCLLFALAPVGNAALYVNITQNSSFDGSSWRLVGFLNDWFGEDSDPSPCYRVGACELGLQLYLTEDYSNYIPKGAPSWFARGAWLSAEENLGDLGKALRKNVGLPMMRLLYIGTDTPNTLSQVTLVCLVYRTNGGAPRWFPDNRFCSTTAGGIGPEGTWCEPRGGAITFNYGTVESTAVNGRTRSAPYSLWCNRTVTAKVYAKNLSGGRLYLSADRRLYTDLTIDGRELGTGVTKVFNEGVVSNYTIQSTLGSSGEPQGGQFSGSTVIYIDIQ